MIRIATILLSVCMLLCSCSRQETVVELQRRVSEHDARNYDNWRDLRGKPFSERVLPAPELLLDYLRLDNKLNGYAAVPGAPDHCQTFVDDVCSVIEEFPAPVQKHLQDYVVGIFLVTDLGSTAYGEALRHFSTYHSGFVVLDVGALDRAGNAWATWRETTPFEPSPEMQIAVRIAKEQADDRKQAISFILLHELGHLVGAATGSHALWWTGGDPSSYPFSKLSWRKSGSGVVSLYDDAFQNRSRVRFYAPPDARLPSRLIPEIYSDLQMADFVSLYAATSLFEDFAETYAMYVHVVMQKRPWCLTLKKDGQTLVEIAEPILEDWCSEKRQYIAGLMAEE